MGLISAQLLLSILDMGGVGLVTLTPAQTPVPAVIVVLSSSSASMASSLVTLITDVVMTVSATIYQLSALSVTTCSTASETAQSVLIKSYDTRHSSTSVCECPSQILPSSGQ